LKEDIFLVQIKHNDVLMIIDREGRLSRREREREKEKERERKRKRERERKKK
jgi:hypothetical protein